LGFKIKECVTLKELSDCDIISPNSEQMLVSDESVSFDCSIEAAFTEAKIFKWVA